MNFEVGTIFKNDYPHSLSRWIIQNPQYKLVELEMDENKNRLFQIQEKSEEELSQEALILAKARRAEAVENIKVEVDGMVFDGDEVSQGRISRTITAAIAAGAPLTTQFMWVLADNTIANPTVAQLAQALYKAGLAQSAVWASPYEDNAE